MEGLEEMKKLLEECDQSHILKFWNELNEAQQKSFLGRLRTIDFKRALEMWQKAQQDSSAPEKLTTDDLAPINVQVERSLPHSTIEQYRNIGLEEISKGSVAVIVLAGGQGTRLGMPYPKGMCPTGIPSGKTLFQIQAQRIQRLMELAKERTGEKGVIHWYLMTSQATHLLTEKYLQQNKFFDLNKENVTLFKQCLVPIFDLEGKIMLEERDDVALAPDGNGGIYRALHENGLLEEMEKKGIKYVHVHSVDNILIKVADPVFLGKCIQDQVDCGLKVIQKIEPTEPLGLVVKLRDQVQVVEYSELPYATASLKSPDNEQELLFNAGNICNHFFTVEFLKRVAIHHENDLKIHVAKKICIALGPDGDKMRPPLTPNCIKLEKFIFDAVSFSKNLMVWQVDRNQEFSPVKNSDFASQDNFVTAKRDLLALHKTWVENMGGKCQGDGVEVSPLLSYDGEGLSKVKGKEYMNEEVILSEIEEKQQERWG
ncbi:UDP-N-acetylhexosamine pyrophosphorylase-like protein 1 [Anthonomus grandis grandis]|uniref:UDP-N-acetylhexosamine pyrophosphorylase-like protein 1 n=1 Tax=Anthonomus grandis grandis TaxID=2921223 RepID=UPI002165DC63|nr:UDP-N-acetylhexosamine pyrophosphorylase-like protein 1 [Anthonomus grandis grandis]